MTISAVCYGIITKSSIVRSIIIGSNKGLMIRLFGHITARLITLVMVGAVIISSGCTTSKGEGFAIYSTKEDIPPAQMEALSHIDLAERPIIAMSDIITYNAKTHEIALTASAYERILNLEVPVRGKSFVVCVDRRTVYWGAFWTPVSSLSFDGVSIVKPLGPQNGNAVKIELGYPSSSFYAGEDPRLNAELMNSLEQAGKLK